jgi:hypothetical protein
VRGPATVTRETWQAAMDNKHPGQIVHLEIIRNGHQTAGQVLAGVAIPD